MLVPTLDFYQYPLFSVSHGVNEFYPLEVTAYGVPARLMSEDDFARWLRTVFASSETKRIIGTLLAMVEQPAGAGEPQLTLDQLQLAAPRPPPSETGWPSPPRPQ